MNLVSGRTFGAVLVGYSIVYTFQVVFGSLYADSVDPADVFRVMNYFTAAGIVASVAVAWRIKRECVGETTGSGRYLATQAGFYIASGLAIWFFALWFRLLTLGDGEPIPESDLVIWFFVAAITPLVLGTIGVKLWKSSGP